MSKIYTGKGDQGITDLLGRGRVPKNDIRVETYGTIDEANSALGIARSLTGNEDIREKIYVIQKQLFVVAAEMAAFPESRDKLKETIKEEDIRLLENLIDLTSAEMGVMQGFTVPGDTQAGAVLDLARTVVRRAERLAVGLLEKKFISTLVLVYLNRLSDLIYLLARLDEKRELLKKVRGHVIKELTLSHFKKKESVFLNITLDTARHIVREARSAAQKIGIPMAISVVDNAGNLVVFERMDESLLVSIEMSLNKAYTAVALKMATHLVAQKAQPGGEIYGIEGCQQGKIVLFGGGYPLIKDGNLLGGIGVSGGTVEEDMLVAEAGMKVFSGFVM